MSEDLADDTATRPLAAALPRPGRGARWRWSAPRRAFVGGGILATVLSLGTVAGAAGTTSASTRPRVPPGAPPGKSGTAGPTGPGSATTGGIRPTVAGRITALHGRDIVVAVPDGRGRSSTATTTVVYSATTSFKAVSSKSGTATTSSSSALKVGDFVAVRGTRHGNTVSASAVVIGAGPPAAPPRRGRAALRSG